MRIIIAGGRNFNDYRRLEKVADNYINRTLKNYAVIFGDEIEIISGRAKGADTQGEIYSYNRHYKLKTFEAKWDMYGKSAGYRRNEQMASYAYQDPNFGALLAFWDGNSRGTGHMIDIAKRYNLDVNVIYF